MSNELQSGWLSWKGLNILERIATILAVCFFTVLCIILFGATKTTATAVEEWLIVILRIALVAWICWWLTIFKKNNSR